MRIDKFSKVSAIVFVYCILGSELDFQNFSKLRCTSRRGLQKRPTKETNKKDPQNRPTKETNKKTLQKRPTKETYNNGPQPK